MQIDLLTSPPPLLIKVFQCFLLPKVQIQKDSVLVAGHRAE